LPELAIEGAVEYAINLEEQSAKTLHADMRNNHSNLEERVEFAITDFALGISNVFGDLEEKLERDIRRRHLSGGVGVGWCRCWVVSV
jgi:hypothetical protein